MVELGEEEDIVYFVVFELWCLRGTLKDCSFELVSSFFSQIYITLIDVISYKSNIKYVELSVNESSIVDFGIFRRV